MGHRIRNRIGTTLPGLMRFALTLTRSRHDAEDLVQMTCERALSREGQWSPDTKLESWVFRIMQSIWYNEVRARRVRARHLEEGKTSTEMNAAAVEPTSEHRLYLSRLEAELFEMPEADRTVMVLVCVEGLTYKEAAEVIGIPIGTVMSRLFRARLALMARLDAERAPSSNVARFSKWRR